MEWSHRILSLEVIICIGPHFAPTGLSRAEQAAEFHASIFSHHPLMHNSLYYRPQNSANTVGSCSSDVMHMFHCAPPPQQPCDVRRDPA